MSSPATAGLPRRAFLARAGAASLAAVLATRATARAEAAIPDDPRQTSVARLARMIRERRVSSVEVVSAHFARIDEVNPRLNAVVALCRERALAEAAAADRLLAAGRSSGPLHGVPMTIKDSLDTAGVVSTGGTLGRANHVPARDATVVARLRAAGAILMGKTNTPEFTLSGVTQNLVYGRTFNPYKLTHSTGGSSGGAGAIVAAGGSPFDIGSDFGGSIRGPAHFCGIAGIKPTSGRVPRTGHIVDYGGAFDAYQQLGPMTRWVEDLALLLPLISGPDWIDAAIVPAPLGDPAGVEVGRLRVAVYTDNGGAEKATPEVVAAVVASARHLESLGAAVVQDAPLELFKRAEQVRRDLGAADGRAWVDRLVARAGTAMTHPLLNRGGPVVPASEFTRLVEELDACRGAMLKWMSGYDLIVCPTNAKPAEAHRPEGAPPNPPAPGAIGYTGIYNLTGWPGASVRAGASPDGLPIGVQLVGRPWREDVVLAAAAAVEAHSGGWRPPPI